MKQRFLRIVVLLWIGWYVVGPAAETFDHGNGPSHEAHDILFNAGGGVTLLACAFAMVICEARKLRERYSLSRKATPAGIVVPIILAVHSMLRLLPASTHSPPIPLRI